MIALLVLFTSFPSALQDFSVQEPKLTQLDLLDLDMSFGESQAQKATDGWASVGIQFGAIDFKDADVLGMFYEMQLNIPIDGHWLSQHRIGMGGVDEEGFSFTYFATGVAYEFPLNPTAGANADRWTFRPFAQLVYQVNKFNTPAEVAFEGASGTPGPSGTTIYVDNLTVTASDSFGYVLGGQIVRSQGRLDITITLGYRIMETDVDIYGLGTVTGPSGTVVLPVLESETVDLSGFFAGVSVGYRF